MLKHWARSVLVVFLIVGFLLIGVFNSLALSDRQDPIVSITLAVDESARDEFIERLKKFADDKAFAIRVAQTRRDGRHFLIELHRFNINITAINPFDDAGEFSIFFYQNSEEMIPFAASTRLLSSMNFPRA